MKPYSKPPSAPTTELSADDRYDPDLLEIVVAAEASQQCKKLIHAQERRNAISNQFGRGCYAE